MQDDNKVLTVTSSSEQGDFTFTQLREQERSSEEYSSSWKKQMDKFTLQKHHFHIKLWNLSENSSNSLKKHLSTLFYNLLEKSNLYDSSQISIQSEAG
ncbi:hypothetical protein AV530_016565 [Patagioenas fasciata monilis]|uniref:Uncharacterized protein n=1 Tax=Patagioenas fasciata monilis TaxID=372326 RepID=A0A1V4J315_PATFA|nr:hypothetical protein AV530_016565 [Patagioenas fasciata monilis]